MNPQLNPVYEAGGITPSWTFAGKGGISSSPLVSGGVAYIATNGRHVYALHVSDGSLLWTFTGDDEIMTQPLRAANTLIIGVGNAEVVGYRPTQYIVLGSGFNEIVGLNIADGTAIWALGLPGTGMPTGVIANDVFYHLDGSGFAFALEPVKGGYIWRKNFLSTSFMSALNYVDGKIIAVGNWPNRVFTFDTSGNELWSHDFNSTFSGFSDGPLAVADGIVVGGYLESRTPGRYVDDFYRSVQHVYALRLSDGKTVWDVTTEDGIVPAYNMSAIPMIAGHTVVVGNALGPWMHAFDLNTGKIVWRLKVAGPVKNGPVSTDGRVYFGDLGGCLWSVDLSSGRAIGSKRYEDQFNVGSGVIVGKSLLIGSKSGRIYAVPLASISASNDCGGVQ